MRAVALVALLAAPALAGCLGGGTQRLDAPVDASSALPALPDGLRMDGAEVVARDAHSTTWLWRGTAVGPAVSLLGALSADQVLRPANASFDVPAGLLLEARASMRMPDGADLRVELIDGSGRFRCASSEVLDNRSIVARCRSEPVGPLPSPTRWVVHVHTTGTLQASVPFELELRLRTLPPRVLHQLAKVEPFEAKAEDGTALRGHVYLPEGEGPFATVLEFSPYFNSGGGTPSGGLATTVDGRKTMDRFTSRYLEEGFAVALVNLRGSGISDGCFRYMDHRVQGPDGAAVIEALAAQPWSNSAVGMIGLSYPAASQYSTLTVPPPALKAVVPMSGEYDEWQLLGRFGVATSGAAFHPTRRDLGQGLGLAGGGPLLGFPLTPEHLCPQTVEDELAWEQLTLVGDKDAFLRDLDLRADLKAHARVPILASNGLTDGEGHILQFDGWWDLTPPDRHLVLGQWPHDYPFGYRADWQDMTVAWFDRWLRGGPSAVATGVAEFQDDTGAWHTASAWPPPSDPATLFLSAGTLVLDPAQVRASAQTFLSDGATPRMGLCAGNRATWVSPPLAEDVLIAGNFEVNFTATSTAPDGNLAAVLLHTSGSGGCPDTDAREVRRAVSDLYHRGHLEVGRDFPVGAPEPVGMRSLPVASVVPKGERLVLLIGGGSDELTPAPFLPALTVTTGAGVEGALRLPVVQGSLRFAGAAPAALAPTLR
jgi:predicted acyl esterase